MKILVIRIRNLASLEGDTVIDFTQEPLASAGVFAITGPIGAGKSTILDALCLALFGETPRYYNSVDTRIEIRDVAGSTINQGDVRGILRDGTSDGYAEVDFIGVDKQQYRATWSVNRARGKIEGNIQPSGYKAKNLSTNRDIPGTKTQILASIKSLVGLSFEQFTRSVLLAQGDFSAFLKANNDDRASLLEKLTGTDIYSAISMLVHEKHRDQVIQLKELNLKREGIQTLTGEEVVALEGEMKQLKTIKQDQEKAIAEIGREIKWHNDLAILQGHHDNARVVFENAEGALLGAKPREVKLQQIVRVQPARPLVDSKRSIIDLKGKKEKGHTDLQGELEILRGRSVELQAGLRNATDEWNKQVKSHEDALPKLNMARELDGRLLGKKDQVEKAREELKVATQDHNSHQDVVNRQVKDGEKLEEVVNDIITWKAAHAASEIIARNELLISTRLEDGEKLLKQEGDISLKIKRTGEEIQNKKQEKETFSKTLAELQQTTLTDREEYNTQQQALASIRIDQLEQDKAALDKVIEELVDAAAHWKLQYGAVKEVEEVQKKLATDRQQLIDVQSQLETTTQLLGTAKIEYETAQRMLERAKLAAAENVENLRAQLVENEPCPVCGSFEHPYVMHAPTQDVVLAELEKEFHATEASYFKYRDSRSAFDTECDLLRKNIGSYEVSFKTKSQHLGELEVKWGKMVISRACDSIPAAERELWLNNQLQESRGKNNNLQAQIKDFGNKKAELEKKKIALDQLAEKITDGQNKVKDVERELLSLEEKLLAHHNEEKGIISGLKALKVLLADYFESDQWFDNWKKEPTVLLAKIKKSAKEWNEKVKQYDEAGPQLALLKEKIRSGKEQLEGLAKNLAGKNQVMADVEKEYSELNNERKAIWEGKPVSEIDQLLKQAVEKSLQVMETYRTDAEGLSLNISGKTAQKEQFERDIQAFNEQIHTVDIDIQQWLKEHEAKHTEVLTLEELLQHLGVTPEWLEEERTALRNIENEFVQAETAWKGRGDDLRNHQERRSSDRILEELNIEEEELKNGLEVTRKSLNGIEYRLDQDVQNKESIGELLKIIVEKTKIVDNWAKLNEVIGSADGKKFRQIAQEYTLDVLLRHANGHLEMLSSRYELQRVPGSLGLQVMDQDMGNEIRGVFSLSGGETFLVSLGLALGLASLSSNRMNVESLFIDEGFGSLDQHTLGIAMDALERLQNQGRKVGVITHVQEMQERIGVQIKVSKERSGKSRVEII